MMNHEELKHFHPLDKLGPDELEKLAGQAQIKEFSDSDYVFRLGEELNELLFVLDGAVRVMNIEERTDVQIARGDARARMPLTLNVPLAAVAIAVPPAKILKINYEALENIVSTKKVLDSFRPGHEIVEEEPQQQVESDEPQAFDVPEDFRLPDRETLKKVRKIELKPLKKQDIEENEYSGRKVRYSFLLDDLDDDEPRKEPEVLSQESERRKESARRRKEVYEKKFGLSDELEEVQAPQVTAETPVNAPDGTEEPGDTLENLSGDNEVLAGDPQGDEAVEEVPEEPQSAEQESIRIPLARELHENIETQEYLRAIGLYKQGKWSEAQGVFRALLKANPATILYKQYLVRCEKQLAA